MHIVLHPAWPCLNFPSPKKSISIPYCNLSSLVLIFSDIKSIIVVTAFSIYNIQQTMQIFEYFNLLLNLFSPGNWCEIINYILMLIEYLLF
jgi:hypothetical protein